MIGCAVAYELALRSVQVLLLDKSLPGRATSASAGGLWPIGETVGLGCGVIYHAARNGNGHEPRPLAEMEMLPPSLRDVLVASNECYPELAGTLRDLTDIDIEYDPGVGLMFLIYNDDEMALVGRVARSLPAPYELQLLSAADARRFEPEVTSDLLGAALLEGEHQVNPMLVAEAYKRAAVRLGATVRHDCHVDALQRRGNRVTGVHVNGDVLEARTVVNAAGAWAGRLAETANVQLPVFPIRGQIVLTEALPRTLRACLSTSGCYLAQKKHGEVLIGSTTEVVGFDVSVTSEQITALCRGAVRAVPMLRRVGVKRIWAGLRPGTPDELPVLGPVEGLDGYCNAAGGFRTGIVAAPMTGRMVAQAIVGETPSLPIEPFLASRFDEVPSPSQRPFVASGLEIGASDHLGTGPSSREAPGSR